MAESARIRTVSAGQAAGAGRRRELDVLSTAVVFSLVLVHTAGIFSGFQVVVNKDQSELTTMLATAFESFSTLWIMPLMMLIAGMTLRYSLQRRSVGEFVRERIGRLFVPFLTGLVLFVPPEMYLLLRRDATYQETYFQMYPRFWNVELSLSAFPVFFKAASPDKLFGVSLMWFLLYLFVYTLLLLPVMLYLRGTAGRRVVHGLGTLFAFPGTIFLLALPMGLVEGFLTSEWPSSWNRWIWPLLILYGFILSGDERFDDALRRHRWVALGLGILLFLAYFATFGMVFQSGKDAFGDLGTEAVLARFLKGMASWFFIVAVMGIAIQLRRRVRRRTPEATSGPTLFDRVVDYGREAQLPFYVLHQLPIVVIGFYVVQWNADPLIKFLAISLSSYAVALAVYEVAVRRTAATRFLFGMKVKRTASVAAPRPSPA